MPEPKRIEIRCPFCERIEETTATDEHFETAHRDMKKLIGTHILTDHPDRIYEMAVIFTGPFQDFVRARMDGTRKEGRALTDLQKVANPVNLGRTS